MKQHLEKKIHTLQASKKLASLFQQQKYNNATAIQPDPTAAAKNKVAEEDVATDIGSRSAFSFKFNI
jgi:hypothetical protein